MFQRRYITYALSALTVVGALVWLGQQSSMVRAQTKVSTAEQPAAPVQITIGEVDSASSGLSPRLAGKAYVQNYTVQNLSSANVLAVTTRWTPTDAEGRSMSGGGCSSHSAVATDRPVLRAGESKMFQQTVTQGPPSAQAEIDLVLLDDGTAFGPNRCRDLDRIQARLDGIKMTHMGMLRVLETQGLLALGDLVRTRAEEYRQEGHNRAFMNPKFVGK